MMIWSAITPPVSLALCSMLNTYGIRSLAMQNLASLVKTTKNHSDPSDTVNYDPRVAVFGRMSGILNPYEYRTVAVNLMLDFLFHFFGRHDVIDESLNRADPTFDCTKAEELLEEQFTEFNLPMPPNLPSQMAELTTLKKNENVASLDAEELKMMHMDKLLLVVYNGFLAAAAERERELITVFRSYDKDGDGQLSLEEFQRIVEDIDAGVSPAVL